MPGSLLTMFLGWLATHLVALTALVFLLVWLVLSGTLDLQGHWAQVSSSRPTQSVPSAAAPEDRQLPVASTSSGPAVTEQWADSGGQPTPPVVADTGTDAAAKSRPPGGQGEPARKQPRMIGGTIPLYGDPMVGFRPPAAMPEPALPGYGDLLQQARRSFWNGDFEGAERVYMDIVERYPEDADIYGELGNLYIAMGKTALALDAYFEAGQRLRAMGEQGRLAEVAEILKKNGDERGLQLNAKR